MLLPVLTLSPAVEVAALGAKALKALEASTLRELTLVWLSALYTKMLMCTEVSHF